MASVDDLTLCKWSDVVEDEEGELISRARYFDGKSMCRMVASGADLAELMVCIEELTSGDGSRIRVNELQYEGRCISIPTLRATTGVVAKTKKQ